MPIVLLSRSLLQDFGKKIGLNLEYFFSGSFWVILRYFIVGVSGFIMTLVFTKFSDPSFFGRYQYILSLLSLFSIGTLPGLAFPLMKEFSRGNDKAFFKTVQAAFIFGVISSGIIFFIAPLFVKDYIEINHSIWIVLLAIPFMYSLNYWYVFYEYYGKYNVVSIALSLQSLSLTGIISTQVYFGNFSVFNLIVSYVLVILFFNIVMSIAPFQRISNENKGDGAISLIYGLEVTFQKGLFILVDVAVPFFIPFLFGFDILGYYQIGVFFAIAFGGLISGLSSLYVPLLFKYKKLNYKRVVYQNFLLGAGAFFSYIFIIFFVFPFFYGESYNLAQKVAWIFSITVFCFPLRIFLQNYFATQKKNGIIISTYSIAIVISLMAFYFFSSSSFIFSILLQTILFNLIITSLFLIKYRSLVMKALNL